VAKEVAKAPGKAAAKGASKAVSKAKAKPRAATGKRAAGRPARKQAASAAGAAAQPSSTQRALSFLRETASPLKAVEIAQHLFGAEATQGNVNLVRSAVETLVRRGAVSKSKQGTTVFYQAENAGNAGSTDGAEQVEDTAAVAPDTEQTADLA
jgi:hypothetical protein